MQWFHAQIFAAGHLTLPAPSLPEFYESYHVILRDGKWYSQYPPGYSFVLALGMLAGVPWLVTPLLGAASVVIAYYLSKELFRSERVARISCVLVVCCNFMLLMSAAYMSHVLALICTNLAALCYMRAVKRSSVRYALLMGVATGCLFITRPYTAVAFMFPFMAHAAWQAMIQPAHTLKLLAPSILTFLSFMAVQGWFNWQTTGSPFSYGYTVRWGGGHVPGFHEGPWEGEHTPLRALGFFFNNFAAMNAYFFWLTVPSLLLLPLSLVLIRGNTWAKLGLATFFSLNVFYAFYFHQDFAFGPRLVYESVLFMVILTAHALVALPDIWRLLLKFDVNRAILRGNVVLWCGLLLLISYIYTMPYIVGHLIDNGYPAKMLDFEALEAKVQAMTDKKSIIFVDCNYHSAYSRNPQDEEAEILYLQSLGERNIEAMRHFPGRSYFLLFNSRELFPITENDLYPEAAKKLKKIRQHCWPEMHHAQ